MSEHSRPPAEVLLLWKPQLSHSDQYTSDGKNKYRGFLYEMDINMYYAHTHITHAQSCIHTPTHTHTQTQGYTANRNGLYEQL